MSIGAAKLRTSEGPVWCHLSRNGTTLKFRRFENGVAFEFEADEEDIEEEHTEAQCRALIPGQGSLALKEASVWATILSKLESGIADLSEREPLPSTQVVVPITRLRRYYSSMKVFDKLLFENLAKFYSENPTSLKSLWNDSRNQFWDYNNPAGWTTSKRKDLPVAPASLSEVKTTTEFATYFQAHGLHDSEFVFVQRELNPWLTRQGYFPDNSPASRTGRGGIDLLMRTQDGIPVIGEVKIDNDKNAFFALLQAMTYAVELSTPHQLERLVRQFPQHFHKDIVENPFVEIAVIKVNPAPNDSTLEPVQKLISELNGQRQCNGLRCIRLYQNDGEKWSVLS